MRQGKTKRPKKIDPAVKLKRRPRTLSVRGLWGLFAETFAIGDYGFGRSFRTEVNLSRSSCGNS